jgi:hypothetical protein
VTCHKCHRKLIRFAFSVNTPEGLIGWGPDCAQAVTRRESDPGAFRPRAERPPRAPRAPRTPAVNAAQLCLDL